MRFVRTFSGVHEKEISDIASRLAGMTEKLSVSIQDSLYGAPESFMHLPHDEAMARMVHEAAKPHHTDSLRYVVVAGIGGSALGTQAIYNAMRGYTDSVAPARYPKMIFVDTVDPEFNRTLQSFLKNEIASADELAVVIVTKSGTTVETMNNADLIIGALQERFKEIEKRTFIITDKGSSLWTFAEAHNMPLRFEIPKQVGGRFSVFSPAGLLPLALAGIDIRALCEGARGVNVAFQKPESDVAFSAAITFAHYQKGVRLHNSFFFHPELEALGKWWRQLIGESLGKESATTGRPEGINPEVSIGTTDLHSVGQMYLAGSQNALTTFVHAPSPTDGGNADKILHAVLEGVKKAYAERTMPFVEVCLDDISEKSLGQFMQFKMIETVLLAHLIGVNAFDQPNVEAYKAHTRKILER